ncbi:uncharacterized protein LOC134398261 [Elgaria multicarinata webbii]|uniref:uncharacterized protein LOC134398261 n=1 Tax=Elgaria multicarinata webbii TaxID=159646 RepID=UPI002FCCFD30
MPLFTGSTLPSHPAEKPTNGFAAELREGKTNSLKDVHVVSLSHQRPEKSQKLDLDHPGGGLLPPASSPKATSPSSLQFRKLPMTPKEVHIARMKSLNQSADSQVYESIQVEDMESGRRGPLEGQEGSGLPTDTSSSCASAQGFFAASVEPGRKDTRTVGSNGKPSQMAAPLLSIEHHSIGQDLATPGRDAPLLVAFDMEKRLSTMYARVCKRPKASQQLRPENHDKPAEQVEEEPPPIPEKHFENIYESLSINTEIQGGEIPELMAPPEA